MIYANDINQCDASVDFKKFADDTTIFTTGRTLEDAATNMNELSTGESKHMVQTEQIKSEPEQNEMHDLQRQNRGDRINNHR